MIGCRTAMLRTLAPRARRPPSPKTRHCITRTEVIAMTAADGPRSTAASAPPTRWPEVPPATGKLIICAEKTKAAVTPIRGTARDPKRARVLVAAAPTPATPSAAHETATGVERKPSGTCMVRIPWRILSRRRRRGQLFEDVGVWEGEHHPSRLRELVAWNVAKASRERASRSKRDRLARRPASIRGRDVGLGRIHEAKVELSRARAGRGRGTVGDAGELHLLWRVVDDLEIEALALQAQPDERILSHTVNGDHPRSGAAMDGGHSRQSVVVARGCRARRTGGPWRARGTGAWDRERRPGARA